MKSYEFCINNNNGSTVLLQFIGANENEGLNIKFNKNHTTNKINKPC